MSSKVCVPRYILEGSSELWVRKVLAWFRLYDKDKKGKLGAHEIEENFLTNRNKSYTAEQTELLPKIDDQIWNHLYAPCTRSVNGEKVVMWEDFLKSRYNQVFNHPEEEKASIKEVELMFLKLFDKNKDGIVTVEEYTAGEHAFGFPEHGVRVMLAVMDKDMDGLISEDEDVDMFTRFHMSTEFDSGTYALGFLPSDDLEIY